MNRLGSSTFTAWFVHAYTALGLLCAAAAYLTLKHDSAQAFFLWLAAAVIIDSTDGYLARKFRVAERLPEFDGRKLDDIVDYLTYVFVPVLAVWEWGLLPEGLAWVGVLPLLASGYGFSQQRAKTEESFVGFPSYWNVVVFYMVTLEWNPILNALLLVGLSILVFWPIHYIYPTRARWLMPLTLGLAGVWGIFNLVALITLGTLASRTAATASLFFPVYYVILSFVHHRRVHKAAIAQSGGPT